MRPGLGPGPNIGSGEMALVPRLVERGVDWVEQHQHMALGLFTLSRVLPFAVRLALLLGRDSNRLFDWVKAWQAASLAGQGQYPYIHYWSEYPPLYPWLTVLAYGVSRVIPLGPDGRLTFYALLGALLIAADIGLLVLVHRLARQAYGPRAAAQAGLLYGFLALPLYLYVGWFDTIPAFLFVLALERLLTRRAGQSAVAAAVGGLFKVFPLLAVPVAWHVLPAWRDRLKVAGITGLIVMVVLLPLALAGPTMTAASVQALLGRSSWETIWALAEGYTGFGQVAPLSERTDPAAAGRPIHPSWLPWPLITLVLIGALIWLFTRQFNLSGDGPSGSPPSRRVVALAGLSLNLLLLFSRGYSPQFLIWLLPLLIIVFPGRIGLLCGLLLVGANLLEYPIYVPRLVGRAPAVLGVAVLTRTILLVGLSLAYGRILTDYAHRD